MEKKQVDSNLGHKIFEATSFINTDIALLKMIDMEINKDDEHGLVGKENYIIEILFENIFHSIEFNEKVELYYDKIYNTILEKTGIYLESIEAVDENEIFCWGSIYKENDKFYTYKPDSFE
jgi:hypothetical protein